MHSVLYTIKAEGEMNIHNATWYVINIENNTNKEFRTVINTKKTTNIFQLKMKFRDNPNKVMEIDYLSPNPVILKLTLRRKSQREDKIIANKTYHKMDANKWANIVSLSNYITDYNYYLNFEFAFLDVIKVSETELSNDFQNLLSKGLYADLTMQSCEGTEYQVHKAVLASRSAVLKAHLEQSTRACTTNVLQSPFESEVLNEVLTFIYSDQVPKIDEIPDKLLVAADYYQLDRLKSLCEEALYKKLTFENAVEILHLAYLHSANTLLEHTLEFTKYGHAKAITKTEEWAKISSVDLIKKMYEYNVDERIVYINVVYR
ncbi:hypothetical protein K1T71_010122 [Dendrolimus kikuchii]|uniref:Uncharacterized protein n=1 Tax=Dendrolimus kikuchii TaxID=765133 RepID=A0ACC1CR27_9NEOP|nr:hypothetical protein K1T71_010122 [Dendrolimus kikuchii]